MHKKFITVAVAGTLASPLVAQAGGHEGVTVYGRINNAISIADDGANKATDLTGVASRFGIRGNADIGNGLSAFGRYEFATNPDREEPNPADLRLGFVGISGGFGSVSLGNQWSAFYNHFGTIVSPTYTLGAGSVTPFRASNTIKYSNSFGPVSLEIDVRLNESNEGNDIAEGLNGDGHGIGLTISPTDHFSIGIAADSEENGPGMPDTDRVGVGVVFSLGGFGMHVGVQQDEEGAAETDTANAFLSYGFGATSVMVGFGNSEPSGGGADTDTTFLGLYHNLGDGLRLWAEHRNQDTGAGADTTNTLLGMRIDF